MIARSAPSVPRLLTDLRQRGEPVAVSELARRLMAASGTVEPRLARSLVATCLGVPEDEVGNRLAPEGLRPAILEVGAVRIDALRPGLEFASLVRPASPVPRRITALTGIETHDGVDAHRARERGLRTLGDLLDHQERPPGPIRPTGRRRTRGVVPSRTGGNPP